MRLSEKRRMLTVRRLTTSAIALTLCGVILSACVQTTPVATAIEAELCRAWRDSLPTRSQKDTEQTRAEIGRAYDVQAAACPNWKRFP